jgi:lysophospholipid acyltransferase (LPLAT)-like uncharacterized protein
LAWYDNDGCQLIRREFDINNFCGIVPDDHRGDSLRAFGDLLGVKTFPMDLSGDSTMSIGKRLVELIRDIKKGRYFLIHPDGPAGPAYRVKPGLPYISQKTHAPILPMGCYCRHAFHIPRWDRYTLPLPFSKVHIQIGNIIRISKDEQDLSEISQDLEDILNRLTFQASANYYEMK